MRNCLKKSLLLTSAAFAAIVLAACGGGGDVYCRGAAENPADSGDFGWNTGISMTGHGCSLKWTDTPTRLVFKHVASVAVSSHASCFVTRNGVAHCVGANRYGELGNGYIDDGGACKDSLVIQY